MTEAPAEQPIRPGPAAANVARSIWHQKELLVLGLVLGLALGWLALPKVLSGGSTYDATIRMRVVQAPTDVVVADSLVRPRRSDAPGGASPEVLKDVLIADGVLKQLNKSKSIDVLHDLTPILLLNRLSITRSRARPPSTWPSATATLRWPPPSWSSTPSGSPPSATVRGPPLDSAARQRSSRSWAGRRTAPRAAGDALPSAGVREMINKAKTCGSVATRPRSPGRSSWPPTAHR